MLFISTWRPKSRFPLAVISETPNWYLNLRAASKNKTKPDVIWTDTLSLPSALNLGEITAGNFSKLIDNIKADKTWKKLNAYVDFYNVGTPIPTAKTINQNNYLNYLRADSLKGN